MRQFSYDTNLETYYNKDSIKIPKDQTNLNLFLDELSRKLNIEIGNMIGVGFEGQVYEIKDANKVIKLQPRTCDDYSDIKTSLYLKDKKLKYIANIYEVGIIINNTFNSICINGKFNETYYTISERLNVNDKLKDVFEKLEHEYNLYSERIYGEHINEFNGGDAFLNFMEDFHDYDNSYINKFLKLTKYKKEVKEIIFILDELLDNEIEYNDFMVKNFGFNEKEELCIFDVNGYEDNIDIKFEKTLKI